MCFGSQGTERNAGVGGRGLHLLSCLHGHMCFFVDKPLAHPSCKITLPPMSHFLLPAWPQPVQAFSDMVILLLQDRRLPPPSSFPAHMAPPGSGQRPRRQDLNSKNAFLEKAVNTRDRYYCIILPNDNRIYRIKEVQHYANIFTNCAF